MDASNAFNALNRAAALHNVRISCPTIATYAINTYRLPARLFILGGKELTSAEGTMQGDPLAMSLYAISVQPLISILQSSSETRQCWFADDATGSGSLEDIKKWWNALLKHGPDVGYFPNAMKCWLITKPDKEVAARILFDGTAFNLTARGLRETLERGANTAPDGRLDIHARGVWERQRSAFVDVRVFHPNADFIEISHLSKSIANMRMRRNASTPLEF